MLFGVWLKEEFEIGNFVEYCFVFWCLMFCVFVCLFVEKYFLRRFRSGDVLVKNSVVRFKSYNTSLLNFVVEYEVEGAAVSGSGIRRYSVFEMTFCFEF